MSDVVGGSVQERVGRGARELDALLGVEWRDRIRLDAFNIRSGRSCILGQLWDGWLWAPVYLLRDAREFGFQPQDVGVSNRDGAALQQEWVRLLSAPRPPRRWWYLWRR